MAFYRRRWKAALLLGISYFALAWLAQGFSEHPATLFPASAVALSALFLEGIELWPVVYIASLLGGLVSGYPLLFLIVGPIAQTLQAVLGASLMRKAAIDPLFRRSRDTFLLIGIVALVSSVVPIFSSLANLVNQNLFGTMYALAPWSARYTGILFCLLVLTPFLLRWLAKLRFYRTLTEAVETVAVLAVLIALDYFAFVQGVSAIAGIPTAYFLLIPLFWISLRLRPRFVTLALLITSIFAVVSLYTGDAGNAASLFNTRLFQTEEFLIVISIIFSIVVSLEEDRRLGANLIRSQVATLENAVARISSESRAKNDFIAILAHELRNPLAPIMYGIDLMKMKEGREADEMATLTIMEGQMQTVRRLLDDLLDISRIIEGKLALKKEPVDLENVVKRALLSTAHHIEERHQPILFTAPPRQLIITGDPVRIEQAFSNLIANASKYSDSGQEISIRMHQEGNDAEIVVRDSGLGIDPEDLDSIFTPFHQADLGARNKKGLGIGLALVRNFIERHNGSVVAQSEGRGKGSSFTVRLPLAKGTSPSFAHPTPTPKTSSVVAEGKGPRILLVDDMDTVAWGIGRLLELKGCTVSYAYNGRQAIANVVNVSPDIVFLDIGLPDIDGYTVAKTVRANGYTGRLIALTGFSTEEAKAKGREAGFEHYLTKPASFADLKRVIPEIA